MPAFFCPSCSYNLQAQITMWGARCPECGGRFTAQELSANGSATNGVRSLLARWKWFVLLSVVGPPVSITCMFWYGLDRYWDLTWPLWLELPFLVLFWATPALHLILGFVLGRKINPPWPWWSGCSFGVLMTVCSVGVLLISATILGVFLFGCC